MQFVQSAAEINENTARMVNITPQTLNTYDLPASITGVMLE